MLQQTQVATVIPYWEKWMARFPTIQALAAADEQDVLAHWQGLGYYRRCRLLQKGSQWVAEHGLPRSAKDWLEVPGVGPYTAGAIASIAQGDPAPLVDGNVERVYARLTGDASAGPLLTRNAWVWAAHVLYKPHPGDWNQALMEFGATVCKPVKPECPRCPLADRCVARLSWRVDELPTRPEKVKTVGLRHAVWVPYFEGRYGVRQIPAGSWWEGMWEFPRAEEVASEEVLELREIVGPGWLESIGEVRHSVTHHRIVISASLVRCESMSPQLRWLDAEELKAIPMPNPQRKVLAKLMA